MKEHLKENLKLKIKDKLQVSIKRINVNDYDCIFKVPEVLEFYISLNLPLTKNNPDYIIEKAFDYISVFVEKRICEDFYCPLIIDPSSLEPKVLVYIIKRNVHT